MNDLFLKFLIYTILGSGEGAGGICRVFRDDDAPRSYGFDIFSE
jgi:hypothetical protein